jgi:HAD superfamily hydrolase (TIGR01509 family)
MHIWQRVSFKSIAAAYEKEVVLKPGVYGFLQHLKQNKIKMVLATATDRHLMEPALHRNKIYDFFDEIFTCSQVGSSKHKPLIYHKALEFLGLEKDEVWVFEDAYYAVKTAVNAGFKVAVIYDKWEYEHFEKAPEGLGDLYIKDYREIDLSQFM